MPIMPAPKDTFKKIYKYHRLLVTASFAFCVITFEPIKMWTCSAPQNDGLKLIFVKGKKVVVGKMARNGRKTEFIILLVIQARKKIFTFCDVTFEPIKISSCSAPRIDSLNFSFVKNTKASSFYASKSN